jgi:hypothetical protein
MDDRHTVVQTAGVSPELSDLVYALRVADRDGHCFRQGACPERLIDALRSAAHGVEWMAVPERVGSVTQVAEEARMSPEQPPWSILVSRLNDCWPPLRPLRPEVRLMRYSPRRGHITPHRDHRRYLHALATLTLIGSSDVLIHSDRSEERLIDRSTTQPGHLMVLKAWPITLSGQHTEKPARDPRPMHSVRPPGSGDTRISVTVRYLRTEPSQN